jgi:hypothetical protein
MLTPVQDLPSSIFTCPETGQTGRERERERERERGALIFGRQIHSLYVRQLYILHGMPRCLNHRNLSTRMSKCPHVQQTFLTKNLIKSLLISTLDKVTYYKGTFLQGSTKPLFTTQNRLETSWKKIRPFSNMLLLVLRFLWLKPAFLAFYRTGSLARSRRRRHFRTTSSTPGTRATWCPGTGENWWPPEGSFLNGFYEKNK